MAYVRHPPASVDTVVDVGGQHFVAHRHVLAEHCGYFRGMLMVDGPVSQTLDGGNVLRPTFRTTTVSATLVSPRTFAVLLDYMYSSRLRLDTDIGGSSVSDVLRSAQLLDMPKVVDLCRQYVENVLRANVDYARRPPPPPLSMRLWPTMFVDHQEQQHQLASTNIIFPSTSASSRVIRPIASRRPLPSQHSYHHHQNYCHEFMSSNTMLTVSPIERQEQKQQMTTETSLLPVSQSQQPTPSSPQPNQDRQRPVSPANSSSSATGSWISVVSDGESRRQENSKEVDETKSKEDKEAAIVDASSSSQQPPSPSSSLQKVVVDIAYCDGPVKFQRILNENCDLVMFLQTTIVQCQKHRSVRSSKDKQQQQPQQRGKLRPASAQNDTNAVPAAGVRKRKRRREMRQEEGDEDDEEEGDDGNGEDEEPNGNGTAFCVHCKHTFKSRYCYMKHMRRHLNPLTAHECDTAHQATKPASKNTEKPNTSAEVVPHVDGGATGNQSSDDRASKLLEINSTFYPCKTCGSKFPSYYFLHKHQRIFHADNAPSATDDEKTSQSADDCETAAPFQKPKSSQHV